MYNGKLGNQIAKLVAIVVKIELQWVRVSPRVYSLRGIFPLFCFLFQKSSAVEACSQTKLVWGFSHEAKLKDDVAPARGT